MAPKLSTLFIVLALSVVAVSQQLDVKTPVGMFRGKILTSFGGVDFASYRGIPYALPPTGNGRFGLPVPHPIIEGVHDAGDFGPMCLQHWRGLKLGNEDCLYLNVYTPLDKQVKPGDGLKKVLVFIPGGGFVVGASNLYIPGDLVTRADVVVVTFNYRLGWMGFLKGNSSSLPGNVAFWDQVLALKWVKDNIRYFGGDPDDVTLFGESAGSMSVSILSLSPATKGLFTRVFLLSGSAPIVPETHRTTNNLLEIAANKFGCQIEPLSGNEDAVVTCLKQLPAEDFVADFEFPLVFLGISFGDDLIPRPLSIAMEDLQFLEEIDFFKRDYLASITVDDGYILWDAIFWKVNTSSLDTIAQELSLYVALPDNNMKTVLLEYEKLFHDIDKSGTAILTDGFFLSKTLDFLDAFRSLHVHGTVSPEKQAYLMLFDHIPKYVPNKYVLHAIDLCYMFDLTPKDLFGAFYFMEPEGVIDKDDLKMKEMYIDLIIDFIRTGNPGLSLTKKNGVTWSPYEANRKNYLSLSLQPEDKENIHGDRLAILKNVRPQSSEERFKKTKSEL